MGFKGFQDIAGFLRVFSWPIFDDGSKENEESFGIRYSLSETIHFASFNFDEFIGNSGKIRTADYPKHSELIVEPDQLIYPSEKYTEPFTVKRLLENGNTNTLELYPVLPRDFYFMAGELNCLLDGPGVVLDDPNDEPVGPHGPVEDYEFLRVFQFINQNVRKPSTTSQPKIND